MSIDAGNALVEAIRPFVRSTRRVGSDAEIGGFGGTFDLKAVGYTDPVLVSGTDGVGTKIRIAIDVGIHDLIGELASNREQRQRCLRVSHRNRSCRHVRQRSASSRRRIALLP